MNKESWKRSGNHEKYHNVFTGLLQQEQRRINAKARLFLLSRKKGHFWIIINARVMCLGIEMYTNIHLKRILNYEVRLKFYDDTDYAKGITIARLFFLEKQAC